ncbi:hypothetical protein H2200_001169 [Cladophialophora chaetospira]|uniref:Cysteine-rich transmembrane CYSTM domain-containing protein n=1 Tax=Cladophialophora chaetospira TaxID=386627 RepID=A0AA38XL59_9EURO|nr:hypothetical protein H2200_001169 [Cladophialophora chaetospira]
MGQELPTTGTSTGVTPSYVVVQNHVYYQGPPLGGPPPQQYYHPAPSNGYDYNRDGKNQLVTAAGVGVGLGCCAFCCTVM